MNELTLSEGYKHDKHAAAPSDVVGKTRHARQRQRL